MSSCPSQNTETVLVCPRHRIPEPPALLL